MSTRTMIYISHMTRGLFRSMKCLYHFARLVTFHQSDKVSSTSLSLQLRAGRTSFQICHISIYLLYQSFQCFIVIHQSPRMELRWLLSLSRTLLQHLVTISLDFYMLQTFGQKHCTQLKGLAPLRNSISQFGPQDERTYH